MKKIVKNIFVLFLFASCSRGNPNVPGANSPENMNNEEVSVVAVFTEKSIIGSISEVLEVTGDIESSFKVDIYPDVAGKITRVEVELGDWVKRGDIIAYIDASAPGANYRNSPIIATTSGTIIDLKADTGATFSPQLSVATISPTQDLEVKSHISEKFITRLNLNQRAYITVDAYPNKVFYAKTKSISPVVDSSSRTIKSVYSIDDKDKNLLKPGMFSFVKIVTNVKTDVVKIREASIVERLDEIFVFVVSKEKNNYIAKKRIVELGLISDGTVEIVSGLDKDEIIITRGQSLIADGDKINVVQELKPVDKDTVF